MHTHETQSKSKDRPMWTSPLRNCRFRPSTFTVALLPAVPLLLSEACSMFLLFSLFEATFQKRLEHLGHGHFFACLQAYELWVPTSFVPPSSLPSP